MGARLPPSRYPLSCWLKRGHRWPDPVDPALVTRLDIHCEKLLPGDPLSVDPSEVERRDLHPVLRDLLPRMTALTHLDIHAAGDRPVDLRALAMELGRVQHLTLGGNNCRRTLLTSVGALHSLRSVDLTCHGTDADFTVLGKLPLLEEATITFLGEPGPKTLLSFLPHQKLRRLSIPDARQGPESLAAIGRLRSLRDLSLRTLYAKGPALRALTRLPDLERLEVDGIWLDPPEYAVLGELGRLGWLRVIRSHIDDVGLGSLARLQGLRHLEVETWRNRLAVSDRGLRALSAISGLEGLAIGAGNVSCPGITDAGCEALSGLRRLEALRLPSARITDRCLLALRRLPRLRFLDLSGAALTQQGLGALSELPRLETLVLVGARVTDERVAQIARSPALRRLYLLAPQGVACGSLVERLGAALSKVTVRCDSDPSGGKWRSELEFPDQRSAGMAATPPKP